MVALKLDAETEEIVMKVQEQRDVIFEEHEIRNIYKHSARKAARNGNGEDYIPLLFEDELNDAVTRMRINLIGGMNRCA